MLQGLKACGRRTRKFLREILAWRRQVWYTNSCLQGKGWAFLRRRFLALGLGSNCIGRRIEVVITAPTRNFWKLRPFRPLKMSAAQGFARVRISQFHIVLACFSCILPEQGLHLRNTESCPSGRRCSTRNAVDRKVSRVRIPNSPPKTQSYQGFCPYDWAFLFSQGHIGVHDFRQELRCASRSALCSAGSGYCPLHLPR